MNNIKVTKIGLQNDQVVNNVKIFTFLQFKDFYEKLNESDKRVFNLRCQTEGVKFDFNGSKYEFDPNAFVSFTRYFKIRVKVGC